MILLSLLVISLTGCAADLMGDEWQAAKADAEQARAAAQWAYTHQVEAETAAEASQAQKRAEARTASMVATWVILTLTLAGLGSALCAWAWMRARLVFADKFGLYPVVAGQMTATNLNEPGAQHVRIAPGRTPYQVLPAPENDPIELIPEPVVIDARSLQHIERLLLTAPAGSDYDSTD